MLMRGEIMNDNHIPPDEGAMMCGWFPVTHTDRYMFVTACSAPSTHDSWQVLAAYALGSAAYVFRDLKVRARVL